MKSKQNGENSGRKREKGKSNTAEDCGRLRVSMIMRDQCIEKRIEKKG